MKHVGDLDKREGFVFEQAAYVEGGVTVDPVVGGVAADAFRYFG